MDLSKITIGLVTELEELASPQHSASVVGSGFLDVYSSPSMVALMEKAAAATVEKLLPEGYSTVGIGMNFSHMAATPIGMKVRARAELIKVEDKRLSFTVEAFDEKDKIGACTHDRYIIEAETFKKKVDAKVNS